MSNAFMVNAFMVIGDYKMPSLIWKSCLKDESLETRLFEVTRRTSLLSQKMPAFWTQIKEHKIRFLKTCVLLIGYLAQGLFSGVVGPTLLDLRQQVSASLTTIAYALTARAGGHAIGCLISEYFFH